VDPKTRRLSIRSWGEEVIEKYVIGRIGEKCARGENMR